jgi:transposase-like protein
MVFNIAPEANVHYPRSLQEFDQFFVDEEACRAYLASVRWPDGFVCPKCLSFGRVWITSRGLYHCRKCDYQCSVTAGTILQDIRKPLRLWLQAMWHVTNQKYGASALGLQRALGLGSYQAAWTWLHKLRRAMVRPFRDRLSGLVEVDETFIGGIEEGARATSRGSIMKAPVAIACEVVDARIGRSRLAHLADTTARSLTTFVKASVEPHSTVRTDAWRGYRRLGERGYRREMYDISATGHERNAHKLLPHVHRVASLLKRWWLGTHQGAISPQHLAYYLDEFTFRFNRRTSRSRGLLFFRLVQQVMLVDPAPYRDIVGGTTARSRSRSRTTTSGSHLSE